MKSGRNMNIPVAPPMKLPPFIMAPICVSLFTRTNPSVESPITGCFLDIIAAAGNAIHVRDMLTIGKKNSGIWPNRENSPVSMKFWISM